MVEEAGARSRCRRQYYFVLLTLRTSPSSLSFCLIFFMTCIAPAGLRSMPRSWPRPRGPCDRSQRAPSSPPSSRPPRRRWCQFCPNDLCPQFYVDRPPRRRRRRTRVQQTQQRRTRQQRSHLVIPLLGINGARDRKEYVHVPKGKERKYRIFPQLFAFAFAPQIRIILRPKCGQVGEERTDKRSLPSGRKREREREGDRDHGTSRDHGEVCLGVSGCGGPPSRVGLGSAQATPCPRARRGPTDHHHGYHRSSKPSRGGPRS